MSKIRKHVVMRNKAFHLLFTFFMNKVSEYNTKQLLQELSLGRLNYKELLIREIQKDMRPLNEPTAKVYNRRNNLFTKRRQTNKDDLRNIDLIAYIFSNIKGLVEYQYIRRLTHDDIKNMARFIKYEYFPKETYIFRQGEKSDKFYGIIDGEVQIVETKYSDKLRVLKDLLVKIDEREKISDEYEIFFLSGNKYNNIFKNDKDYNYCNSFMDSNKNYINKFIDDDISIRTKNYFVSKMSIDNIDNKSIDYSKMNFENSSVSSLSDNLNLDENEKIKKRRLSFNEKKNRVQRNRYYKSQTISKFMFKPNFQRKLTLNKNTQTKRANSAKKISNKIIIPKLVYKSLKYNRKKNKENKYKLNEEEKKNVNSLSKNLMIFGKILSEGSCFGDQEMCKKQKRNYSLYCLTDCHLFSLKKDHFEKYLLSKIVRSELLKTNFILDKLSVVSKEQHFFKLITKIIPKLYDKGQILYTPFDTADHLYLVYKGECAICETSKIYSNKSDFLSEKPEMKIISILNEGGIGGLEGYQKDVNYEKYMVVNSSLTIILKLDIREFDDSTFRFRRSLEPLYYQQKRLIFSTQRKGLFFKIGRKVKENNEEKIKLKHDIKESTIFKDKNKLPIKIENKIQNERTNNTKNKRRNLFIKNNNEKYITFQNNPVRNITESYTEKIEAKIYSPIKILIKQKKLELEDTTSVLTSYIKEIKHNKINVSEKKTINDMSIKLRNEDSEINHNMNITKSNETVCNSTVFKQKKYFSFYHQKFGRNPISLKGYFSQEKNNEQINRFENIKKNIYNIRASLNNNIFNFYKKVADNIKYNNNDERTKRYSWDKGKINTEDNITNKNNILNIYNNMISRKFSEKIKRNPKMLNSYKRTKIVKYSISNKMKLPSLTING